MSPVDHEGFWSGVQNRRQKGDIVSVTESSSEEFDCWKPFSCMKHLLNTTWRKGKWPWSVSFSLRDRGSEPQTDWTLALNAGTIALLIGDTTCTTIRQVTSLYLNIFPTCSPDWAKNFMLVDRNQAVRRASKCEKKKREQETKHESCNLLKTTFKLKQAAHQLVKSLNHAQNPPKHN